MPATTLERRRLRISQAGGRSLALVVLTLGFASGCNHSKPSAASVRAKEAEQESKTSGSRVVKLERRDIRMTVIQPGTIQAFESAPIYARIAGYVDQYRFNIGDRVKKGDVMLDMWVPDLAAALNQKKAMTDRAHVQIRVTQSAERSAESTLENAKAKIVSAEAGVKRAQASYSRWESEASRLKQLVTERVLSEQVRDETYRQFEEAAAARDQASAMVRESIATRDKSISDLERAKVDIEAAQAELTVARSEQEQAQVMIDYSHIKAPFDGVISQRNVSPGDYLQPGGGTNGRPLFVLEQTDPVRVFVGVPELASSFIKDQDTALIRIQAIPGASRTGKIVRSAFSLNPSSRTLQTEIDIPNADGHLRPGMYVTVNITIDRQNVLALPSNAIVFLGGQNYAVDLEISGKTVRTPILIGPSNDTYTEVLRKRDPSASSEQWVEFDGNERVLAGSISTSKT